MTGEPWKSRKVVIVGAGAVGATFAYALAQGGVADEIVLRDANRELVLGQVLDLAHGQAFFPSVTIREGGAEDYRDAHLVVVTAGAKQRPGESRLDLLQRNARIMHGIIDEIVAAESPAGLHAASAASRATDRTARRAGCRFMWNSIGDRPGSPGGWPY